MAQNDLASTTGYNPKKKICFTYEKLVETFSNFSHPVKIFQLTKEQFHLKVGLTSNVIIQTNQINILFKTFKLCDSSNAYCCVVDIYVWETDDGTKASKFGKTHDLFMNFHPDISVKVILYTCIVSINHLLYFTIC